MKVEIEVLRDIKKGIITLENVDNKEDALATLMIHCFKVIKEIREKE